MNTPSAFFFAYCLRRRHIDALLASPLQRYSVRFLSYHIIAIDFLLRRHCYHYAAAFDDATPRAYAARCARLRARAEARASEA